MAPPGAVITNSIGMKLALIPPGSFVMGSPEGERGRFDHEGPQHEVEITRPFYLGVFAVTQEEFKRVMGMNPSCFSPDGTGKETVAGLDTRRFPVENVSWNEAVEFCRTLSRLPEEKRSGRTYRLPTEAEWEYACRAGTDTAFHYGNYLLGNWGGGLLYMRDESPFLGRTCPVGSYPANAFGLYDMHGNVREWCADWYEEGYYRRSSKKDPAGPKKGQSHVARGGSWFGIDEACRAASRLGFVPGTRSHDLGFRVCVPAVPKKGSRFPPRQPPR